MSSASLRRSASSGPLQLLLCERRRVGRLLLMMCVMNFNAYMCFRPSVNINNLSVATANLEVPVESVPIITQARLRVPIASASTFACPHI